MSMTCRGEKEQLWRFSRLGFKRVQESFSKNVLQYNFNGQNDMMQYQDKTWKKLHVSFGN